ncbi:hypothetical protein [Branchiibius cervicis]|uniref:Peptidase MA-like domain-containing protein n=1 Tax=Branchiibius cervicis TaxID=908252 RepID=A0ABW2AWE2_9MICO
MNPLPRRTAIGLVVGSGVSAVLSGCHASSPATTSATSIPPTTESPQALATARLARSGLSPAAAPVPGATGVSTAVNSAAVVVGTVPASAVNTLATLAMSYTPTLAQLCSIPAPRESTLILAPATAAEYDRWTNQSLNPEERGVTVVVEHVAPWIALKPALTTAEQQNVLAHEMLHALTLTPQARATQPLWLTEGFAQLAATDVTSVQALSAKPPPAAHLPSNAQFVADSGTSYVLAFLFAVFLQIRRKDAVSAFYTPAVTSNPADLNALARRVFGADIAGLTRQWQTSYSAELRKLAG